MQTLPKLVSLTTTTTTTKLDNNEREREREREGRETMRARKAVLIMRNEHSFLEGSLAPALTLAI